MLASILKSENKKALDAIKTLAKVSDIESRMKNNKEQRGFKIIKGVIITQAKSEFNPGEMAGSQSDLNIEDASVLRKKAWTRKKAAY